MRGKRLGEKRPTLVPEAKRNSCANSREVSRRSKTSSIYRRHATMEWVSGQFLNGTSAHIKLYSALPRFGRFT